MDGPQAAKSGHPGTAMALAPAGPRPLDPGHGLRRRGARTGPTATASCCRPGHASILLYSMLYLTGFGLELEDLRQFRQYGSRTPGHPERNHTPGVEVTTGPLGQGVANGVGMGIAEEWLRARFGPELCDHHTFVICSDGDLEEGISHEAASLAGHLGLGRLVYVYDDNHISIDGPTELSLSDDAGQAVRGLRLARRGPRRGRQRLRRPRSGPAPGDGGGGRPVVPAPPQPHRLPVAQVHRHRRRPRQPAGRGRDRASPRRSSACPTSPSGCPTRSWTSTGRPDAEAGRPGGLGEAPGRPVRPRGGRRLPGRARPPGLGRGPARVGRRARRSPPARPAPPA